MKLLLVKKKTYGNIIKQDQAQYSLGRQTPKMLAFNS